MQQQDITLFGTQVTAFPAGIKEAFGTLMEALGNSRAYYGISWFGEDGSIVYYAMAAEIRAGEAAASNAHYETLTLAKGEYITETIRGWMSKTDYIKDVFHELMGNNRPGKTNPCIEWYKSDEELVCMIQSLPGTL